MSWMTSTAADGEDARCLVTFGALPALMGEGDMAFEQLRWTAGELSNLSFNVCAAALATTGIDAAEAERRIGPVMSTPRFLRDTAGARLVVV